MNAYALSIGCARLSLVMLLLLAGCGGGGGDGGGGLTALTYSGNTNQATVSGTNASRLTSNVFGSSDTAGILTATSIEGSGSGSNSSGGLTGVAQTLSHATRRALAQAKRTSSAQGTVSGVAVPVNETVPCEAGSVRTTGTIDNMTGTGTLTIAFNNCLELGLTLNGTIQAQILAFDLVTCGGIPTNFIGSSSRITIRGSGVSTDASGSIQVMNNAPFFPVTETVTNNLITLNNLTGVMTKAENLISTGMPDFVCFPNSIGNLIFNGRIFDNVHGFVDVSTPTPLQINLPQTFPSSGRVRLAGNASAIEIAAISSTRVQLEPDLDNNGIADNIALMNWTDLSGPVGADIGDTPDGDGMHNSWETVNGLNPSVDDAGGDLDGDMVTNLAEYQAGTNP